MSRIVCIAPALWLAIGLFVSVPAFARRQNPPVTSPEQDGIALPNDASVRVYVGVAATWRSLTNPKARPRFMELMTDIAAYAPDEPMFRAEFDDHMIWSMDALAEPDWGAFAPVTDTFRFHFALADK